MLRFKLTERMSDWEFQHGKRLTLLEISEATGINRMTLSKLKNPKGVSVTTDKLDKLCDFFSCEIQDLVEKVR